MDRRSFLKAFISVPAGAAIGLPLISYAEPDVSKPAKHLIHQETAAVQAADLALVISTTFGDYTFQLPAERLIHATDGRMEFMDDIEFLVTATGSVTGSALLKNGSVMATNVLTFNQTAWVTGQHVRIQHIAITFDT